MANWYHRIYFQPGWAGFFFNPFYIIRSAIHRKVKQYAPSLKGKLLDYGCGSKPYKHLFTDVSEYVGLDMQNEGHGHEGEDIDVFFDGKTIPFEDNHFDSVFSCEVFEHVFELENCIAEIHRVMKPGAQALFVVPFVWDEHEVPYDFGRYSSFGIDYLLQKKGFKIVNHDKDTSFREVLAQLRILYIYNHFIPKKNKVLRLLFSFLLATPITISTRLTGWIMPKGDTLYFNNIIVVQK